MNLVPRSVLPVIVAPDGTAMIGLRPEDIRSSGRGLRVRAKMDEVECLGADQIIALYLNGARRRVRQFGQPADFRHIQAITLPGAALQFFAPSGCWLATPKEPSLTLDP